ncbi:MAG: hypothetical protein ABFR97_10960 [Thermodesulfobacteriota bacterium]
MKPLSPLYFPDTDIQRDDIAPLLLFFPFIDYLQTMEGDEEGDGPCRPLVPAPLGDDLPRFKQLLAELKGNEDGFYQGQLSTIALDFMENRDDDSVMAIVNTLAGTPQAKADKAKEKLWQARLILKLAEIQRREQRQLAADLERLSKRQDELFQALKGDSEAEKIFAELTSSGGARQQPAPVRVELLIKAWSRLFLANDLGHHFLLACESETAAAPLLEASESLSGQRPSRLLRLPLPEVGEMTDFAPRLQAWHEEIRPTLMEMAELLSQVAENGLQGDSLARLTSQAAQWTKGASENSIWPAPPAPQPDKPCPPTPHLEFHLLGGSSAQLLARLANEGEPPPSPFAHAILAFVSRRSGSCS